MIRPAVMADTPAIGAMWEKLVTYHNHLDADLPRAAPNGAYRYARNLTDRLEDSHTCILVAEKDGQIVGYVLGVVVDLVPDMFQSEAGGFLADIFVEEAYRGHGIGRALVTHLVDWFRQRGLRQFEWHVSAKNREALAFWHALGGREMMIRMRADL
jgi:GNAT superfamily N-acetyltransferase